MLTVEQLREKIERIDAEIIEKLAAREELSKQIGQLKSKEGKDVIDQLHEKTLFERYEKLCERYKLKPAYVKRLFKTIIANSRMIQK